MISTGCLNDFQQHAATVKINTTALTHYFRVRYVDDSWDFPRLIRYMHSFRYLACGLLVVLLWSFYVPTISSSLLFLKEMVMSIKTICAMFVTLRACFLYCYYCTLIRKHTGKQWHIINATDKSKGCVPRCWYALCVCLAVLHIHFSISILLWVISPLICFLWLHANRWEKVVSRVPKY